MNDKPGSIQISSGSLLSCESYPFPSEKEEHLSFEDQKDNDDLKLHISECRKREYKWSEFPELAHNIDSEDQFKLYFGLIGIRKLLNNGEILEDQIQKIIDAGLIARLVEFMKKSSELQLQEEVVWALIGITMGASDHVQEVIYEGAVPILIQLLRSSHTPLVLNVLMVIANIAFYGPHRDLLLNLEVLDPVIDVSKKALVQKEHNFLKEATRTLRNLCQAKPLPDYEQVTDAVPILCTVVKQVTDIDTFRDAIWALSYLSNEEHKISKILEVDVVPSLVRHLDCPDVAVVIPALRTLGNILTGSDEQTDALLKVSSTESYLKKLFKFLKGRSDSKATRREACWSLSNITCRSPDYLDLIICKTEYIQILVSIALDDILEVQKQAVWALRNATFEATKNQMISMSRSGVFDCMRKLIQQDPQDCDVLHLGLKAIQNFLAFGASKSRKEAANNQFLISMKQKSAIHKIKKLRKSQDNEVPGLAQEIWKKYLQGHILKKNLRLKRAVICFRNERHSLFGLFCNKKKRLDL